MQEVIQKSAYHHGDLKHQLITATRSLVEEKGPDGFSVSEAARAAGVSTAAPYKHFSDRTEMLRAVCLQGFDEMAKRFQAAVAGHPLGSPEAITALGTEYVDFAVDNPGLFKVMFAIGKDNEETEAAGYGCYGEVLRQVAACMGRPEVDQSVLKAAFPLWTYVHGLAFLRIDGKVEFAEVDAPIRELVRFATERLLFAGPSSA